MCKILVLCVEHRNSWLLSLSSCLQWEMGATLQVPTSRPPSFCGSASSCADELLTLVNPGSSVPSFSPSGPVPGLCRAGCSGCRGQILLSILPLQNRFRGTSRVILDPSPSSSGLIFPMSLLATHENIVIPEEVTSTFGESQRFPMSEAASGIEHAQPGGNLEGWTMGLLKSQGWLPSPGPRCFPTPQLQNSTGIQD